VEGRDNCYGAGLEMTLPLLRTFPAVIASLRSYCKVNSTHQRAPIRGHLSREYFPPNKNVLLLAGMNPCAESVRPGFSVPLFFLFLWLAVSSAPRTHRDIRSSRFQKIYQFPASLTGLSGPMVVSHSCFSSWQGRMRRRTV